jgi:hypothetical protein
VVFSDRIIGVPYAGAFSVTGRARPSARRMPFQTSRNSPLMTATLRRAMRALPDNLMGARDCALLLIGFAGGLRRSELASLEVRQRDGAAGWIEQMPDGLAIRLAYSKTDQEAIGDNSVADDPDVRAAYALFDRASPSTYRDLVRARLGARARAGIAPDQRAPLYSGDVESYLLPITLRMGRGGAPQTLAWLRRDLRRLYGEHSEAVLA